MNSSKSVQVQALPTGAAVQQVHVARCVSTVFSALWLPFIRHVHTKYFY